MHQEFLRRPKSCHIEFLIFCRLSSLSLFDFFDKVGCRAFIALLASAMLIGIHITMAVRSGSPIVPVALQGLAYSIYVAVIWPSVPLVVETKYIGTVFGVIISVQNTEINSLHSNVRRYKLYINDSLRQTTVLTFVDT